MSNIVIVEDSPTQTMRTSLALRSSGHHVVCAIDGEDGLDKVFWHRPDVVIVDVELPTIDGFTVCRLIKNDARTQNIKLIMYTAHREVDMLINSRAAGADYWVYKGETGDDELLAHIAEATNADYQ